VVVARIRLTSQSAFVLGFSKSVCLPFSQASTFVDGKTDVVEEIFKEKLAERFNRGVNDVAELQEKYLLQVATNALCAQKLAQCCSALAKMSRCVIANVDHFSASLVAQTKQLLLLVDLPPISLSSDDLKEIVDAEKASKGSGLPGLLGKFPMHGLSVSEAARVRVIDFEKAAAWSESVKVDTGTLANGFVGDEQTLDQHV
jgi:hypothetical protein